MWRIPTLAAVVIALSAVHWLVLLTAISIYGKQEVLLMIYFSAPGFAAFLITLSGGIGAFKELWVHLQQEGSGSFWILLGGTAFGFYHLTIIALGLYSLLRDRRRIGVIVSVMAAMGLSLLTLWGFVYLGFNWNWT